jgi:predicted GIY-YIG superfamily endonuclease
MSKQRVKQDTYFYTLKQGNKILKFGITNNPKRRIRELRKKIKEEFKMRLIGRKTSRKTALRNEEKALLKYKKRHGGNLPPYHERFS